MKNNFTAGLLVGANLLLAVFLIMGVTSSPDNSTNSTTVVENTVSAEPFIGEIAMFGGNFAPRGWALCDGQLLSIAQNTALGRVGMPDDIGGVVAMLLTDSAKWINAQRIEASGGMFV